MATFTVGLSSLLAVGLAALRYKFIALELGAPGVGLLGILTTALTFGVTLVSLGLGTSGVQATAAALGREMHYQRTKSALLIGSSCLGALGGIIVILLSVIFGPTISPAYAGLGIAFSLGIALMAMVISGAQLALLNGLGRIRSLATCTASGAIIGTIVTIAAILLNGEAGLIAALAAAPLATLACSSWYLIREPRANQKPTFRQWWPELRALITLGGIVMLGLLFSAATQLAIRVWIQHTQGLATAGHFQAAWTITSTYLGFVLAALAAEYYPRISSQSADKRRLNISVDKQVQIGLALGAPVLLWMMVFAPFILQILYAGEFESATGILRWQLLGDMLKIVGWAVAFMLLARKSRVAFLLSEISFNVCYMLIGFPAAVQTDLWVLGMAYLGAYALYVPITLWLAYKETGFILGRNTLFSVLGLLLIAGVSLWGLETDSFPGLLVAVSLALVTSLGALFILRKWHRRDQQHDFSLGGA